MGETMQEMIGNIQIHLNIQTGKSTPNVVDCNMVVYSGGYVLAITKEVISDKLITITKPYKLDDIDKIITFRIAEKRELLTESTDESKKENNEPKPE